MLEDCSGNENPNRNEHQTPLGRSGAAANIGTALGAVEACLPPLSISTLPPIQTINQMVREDPSPLTMPSNNAQSEAFQRNVSARRVEYEVSDTGVVLSVPISSQLPYSNNNNEQTYQDGYDSDGEIGPFFDAVAFQLDDEDEVFDEEEHAPAPETTNENQQQETEVPPAASIPNFHLMTVAQLKEELRKRNLPVNGRKDVLLERLLAPRATASAPGQREQPGNISGFAPSAK